MGFFLLTVVLRWIYFATADGPSFADPLIDGDYYDYLADRLSRGQGFEPGPFWQPPLYPIVLGLLYSVLGHDLLWPRIMQSLADGLTAVLAVQIASRVLGNARWALAAGVLVALHGTLVFYSGEILPTQLAILASTVAVWQATRSSRTMKTAIGSGIAVGLGALAVATTMVLLLPLTWFWMKENQKQGLGLLAAGLVVVGTATAANVFRSDQWVLISANGGVNLYLGNAERANELQAIRPGGAWEALVNEPVDAGITSPSGQDGYFVRKALGWCASSPASCLGGLAWKARLLLRSQEIPRNESVEVVRHQSPVSSVLLARVGSFALPHALLLPLAAAGIVYALRKKQAAATLVVWCTLALGAMPVLFFVTGRYRTAMAAMLCVLAVLGAHGLWTLKKEAWREGLAAFVVLFAAVWPAPLPVDAVSYEAEMHYAVGGRRARLGDDPQAATHWQRAVALRPDYLEAHFNLGLLYVRHQQWSKAIDAFLLVLSIDPDHAMARELIEECKKYQ
mgnify:FL=1